jgi:hypothetical protein
MSFASCAIVKLLLHDGAAWLRGLSDTKRKESMKIEDEATYGPGNLRPNDIEWDPDALTSADWVTTTPAGESEGEACFFDLAMNCDANDGQEIILSRTEFIALKRHLAEMRGL